MFYYTHFSAFYKEISLEIGHKNALLPWSKFIMTILFNDFSKQFFNKNNLLQFFKYLHLKFPAEYLLQCYIIFRKVEIKFKTIFGLGIMKGLET